ncbi:MAG: hypothetical protein E6I32_14900 [Chloroflexi bacterium]|nr:MAG: hypothetical protein E6I32_14900 [Chloroflexota bacterium]
MTTTYSSGTRVDHYEIIRMLGHGGMNNVYLAQDILNQEKVVLKFPALQTRGGDRQPPPSPACPAPFKH